MKNKKILGIALAGLMVLSGCSSTVTKDGKDVIAEMDGKVITADEIYENLSTSPSGKSTLFSYALEELIKNQFPVTSDMEQNADDAVTNIKANFQNQYGDDAENQLQTQLTSAGYESLDQYRESAIYFLQQAEFLKQYVKNNFDKVFDDYYKNANPRYLSMIQITLSDPENPTQEEKTKLDEVKTLLKSDTKFEDIVAKYSDHSSKNAQGQIGIVDTSTQLSSSYGQKVGETALSLKEGQTSDLIQGTSGYYVLKCTSTDKDEIKNELKSVDISSPLLIYDSYLVYLAFNSYELKYADKDLEKEIKSIVDEALAQREKQRGGQK